jgi:hypothetical protein
VSYLTENYLRTLGITGYKSGFIRSAKSLARVSIFLSHSHKDKEIVEGFVNLLGDTGQITIYVDWQDETMPRVTSRETAQRIKLKINELDLFVVLATKNAMDSKWVPWEVGVADSVKRIDRIFVVPIVDSTGQYHGNEYMQLYQRIEISGQNQLAAFRPNEIYGSTMKDWLGARF